MVRSCNWLVVLSSALLASCSLEATPGADDPESPPGASLATNPVAADYHTRKTPPRAPGEFDLITLSTLPDIVGGVLIWICRRETAWKCPSCGHGDPHDQAGMATSTDAATTWGPLQRSAGERPSSTPVPRGPQRLARSTRRGARHHARGSVEGAISAATSKCAARRARGPRRPHQSRGRTVRSVAGRRVPDVRRHGALRLKSPGSSPRASASRTS